MQIMLELKKESLEEAAESDKIFVMEKGKIIKFGTPKEIFSDIKEIKRIGLEVPAPIEFADRLRRKGYDIPQILTADELINALKEK